MSIFDQNSPKENSEELLYETIKEELKPILEEWDDKMGKINTDGIYFHDPQRTKLIKDTSKIVMQFIWRKLGLRIPDYSRRVLDDDFTILELKKENTKK